eukprot:2332196-Pleurochrysis_carterae.AAC.1
MRFASTLMRCTSRASARAAAAAAACERDARAVSRHRGGGRRLACALRGAQAPPKRGGAHCARCVPMAAGRTTAGALARCVAGNERSFFT